MKTYKLISILLMVFILANCGSKKNNHYDDVNQMISEAQSGISKVTVNELNTLLEHDGKYKIIDCREAEEYIEGHIPGAINIPRGVLEFSSKISNRREALYVYSQTMNRSSLACPALKLLKYNKVYLVNGGWQEWNKTFPDKVEKGSGNSADKAAPKVEASGGCG